MGRVQAGEIEEGKDEKGRREARRRQEVTARGRRGRAAQEDGAWLGWRGKGGAGSSGGHGCMEDLGRIRPRTCLCTEVDSVQSMLSADVGAAYLATGNQGGKSPSRRLQRSLGARWKRRRHCKNNPVLHARRRTPTWLKLQQW